MSNDREWKFLSDVTGMKSTFNDMYWHYLKSEEYKGTLQDMISASGYGLTPSKFYTPPEEPEEE